VAVEAAVRFALIAQVLALVWGSPAQARGDGESETAVAVDERPVDGPLIAAPPPDGFGNLIPSRYLDKPPPVPESEKIPDPMPGQIRRRGCGACGVSASSESSSSIVLIFVTFVLLRGSAKRDPGPSSPSKN
jgi:hypothetical protein